MILIFFQCLFPIKPKNNHINVYKNFNMYKYPNVSKKFIVLYNTYGSQSERQG